MGEGVCWTGMTEPLTTSMVLVVLDLCSPRAVLDSKDGLARGIGELEFGEGSCDEGGGGEVGGCSGLEMLQRPGKQQVHSSSAFWARRHIMSSLSWRASDAWGALG